MEDTPSLVASHGLMHHFTFEHGEQPSLVDVYDRKMLLAEASKYIRLFQQECTDQCDAVRMEHVQNEIMETGKYWHTFEELTHGAKVAWRNSTRCIGRLHWSTLQVRDMRHLTTAEEIFNALVDHICIATNGGKIRSVMTVFAPQMPGDPGIRVWNPQLIRYAGYRQSDSSIIGDPAHVELTEILERMGWQGSNGSPFDILPLVIQMPGQPPKLFELPREIILEVPLSHPRYEWFDELNLKWHALPVISNMRMEVGGISYTAAPFNGWYMGTEVGARNLADQNRYNVLPLIAEKMSLNTRSDRTLWRDQALVELNIAVLHSFAQHGVSVVDHHTACRQFVLHEGQECKAGRKIAADWGWIVPPMSGSLTPVFHKSYENRVVVPNFFQQQDPWLSYKHSLHEQAKPHVTRKLLPTATNKSTHRLLTLPSRHKVL